MTRLIGTRWKSGDGRSRGVLIGRSVLQGTLYTAAAKIGTALCCTGATKRSLDDLSHSRFVAGAPRAARNFDGAEKMYDFRMFRICLKMVRLMFRCGRAAKPLTVTGKLGGFDSRHRSQSICLHAAGWSIG